MMTHCQLLQLKYKKYNLLLYLLYTLIQKYTHIQAKMLYKQLLCTCILTLSNLG